MSHDDVTFEPPQGIAIAPGGGIGKTVRVVGFPASNGHGPGAWIESLGDTDVHPLLACYLERRDELVRYFRVRLRSEEAAQDLVQDIYLKITPPPAAPIDNPAAYLYRLGTNLMLDRIKSQRRAGQRDAQWRGASGPSVTDWETADAPRADDALAARQRLAQIVAVVNDLPPAVQEAFRLHKLEGLNHAETAAAMGVSRSSVEKYIMTSLKRILAKVGR